MKLVNLTYTIININAAIDSGIYDHISLETIKERIRNGDVLDFLQKEATEHVDLSLLTPDLKKELNQRLLDILEAHGGEERRKWGVENKGLCLLLAWVNEIIQMDYVNYS